MITLLKKFSLHLFEWNLISKKFINLFFRKYFLRKLTIFLEEISLQSLETNIVFCLKNYHVQCTGLQLVCIKVFNIVYIYLVYNINLTLIVWSRWFEFSLSYDCFGAPYKTWSLFHCEHYFHTSLDFLFHVQHYFLIVLGLVFIAWYV